MSILQKTVFDQVQLVLKSKVEEFHMQQYTEITIEELWEYCVRKKWKKRQMENVPLHEVVATIFTVKPSDLLNYEHVSGLQKTSMHLELDLEEINMLLKPLKSEE